MRSGRGRLVSKTWTFDGTFEKDLKEGAGFLLHKDGRIYCGQYKQDQEEGHGEYLTGKSEKMKQQLKEQNLNAQSGIEDKICKIMGLLRPLGVKHGSSLAKIII